MTFWRDLQGAAVAGPTSWSYCAYLFSAIVNHGIEDRSDAELRGEWTRTEEGSTEVPDADDDRI